FEDTDSGNVAVALAAADEGVLALALESETAPAPCVTVAFARAVKLLPVPSVDVTPFLARLRLPDASGSSLNVDTLPGLLRFWHAHATVRDGLAELARRA